MNTRTKTAGKPATAAQNVASTTAVPEQNGVSEPATVAEKQPERLPLADAKPLLFRLEHGVIFANDDTHAVRAKIGASCLVGDSAWGRRSKGTETVWLPASAWEGMATIISQTPDWCRPQVAEFLAIVASNISEPIAGVVIEMADEVRDNPYTDVPETDRHAFSYIYD